MSDREDVIQRARGGLSQVRQMLDSILRDDEEEEDSEVRRAYEEDRDFERQLEDERYLEAVKVSDAWRARKK